MMASHKDIAIRLDVDPDKALDIKRFNEVYTAMSIIGQCKPTVTAHSEPALGTKSGGAISAAFGGQIDDVFAGWKGVPVVAMDMRVLTITIEVNEGDDMEHGEVFMGFAGHGVTYFTISIPRTGSDYKYSE